MTSPNSTRKEAASISRGAPVSALWSRSFLFFFLARAVAKLGDMMLPIALATGLIRYGHGAGAVGAAMASYTACFAGFVIFGGVVADRISTRVLMVGADLIRVGTQSLAAAMFFTGHVVLWQLCAIGAVNGVCAALFQPGVASTIPRIADDVQGANGAVRTAESLMAVLGPALAGVLVGLTSVGGVFAAHAVTYLVSALCLTLMRLPAASAHEAVPTTRTSTSRTFRADLVEGWREFRSRTWMWGVIVIWMVLMIAVWGPTVPLAATEIITEHGEGAYGIVNSALGVGMAAGGLLAMRIRPRHPLRAGAIALFGFCLQSFAPGAHLPVPLIAGGFAVAGAAMAFWSVMWATSIQTQVPGRVLNRIHAYEVAGSVAMLPVGQALAGPASGLFGIREVLLTSGVMAVVVCVALLGVPAIRNLHRVDGAPVKSG
ncbi:MFS transporter [Streptomyces sp. NPDC004647]|uniref:MFS transporter n=1 Tax=Streptomyces sp. NPDC004647 TaxID=3154671 RepID=UPI0033B250C1